MKDYFALLGLERKLTLDLQDLGRLYRQTSWTWHPDRRPRSEQNLAEEQTAHLNAAYRTLKDPYLRTIHLLMLEGVDPQPKPDQALLLEVFELQEILEDPTTAQAELVAAKIHWNHVQEQLLQERDAAFSQWDQGDRDALRELQRILGKRQYLKGILSQLDLRLAASPSAP